jgi:CBS domain-containing protein
MLLTDIPPRTVHTVKPSATIATAARLMCTRSVGALVVTGEDDEVPHGIITDRDLVWMISEGLDPKVAIVGEFLQGTLVTARLSDRLADVVERMRAVGVRRLPVLDASGRLAGIVSLDDVLVLLGREIADAAAAITTELGHERQIGAKRSESGPPTA